MSEVSWFDPIRLTGATPEGKEVQFLFFSHPTLSLPIKLKTKGERHIL